MKKSNYLLIALGIVIAIISIYVASSFVSMEPVSISKADPVPVLEVFNINTILNLIFQR